MAPSTEAMASHEAYGLSGLPLFDTVLAAPTNCFDGSDDIESTHRTQQILKLPDLIAQLAQEAEVLIWDDLNQWYEVIDSQGFEARFKALRYVRGKRNEDAADRPFARMHVHFVLVRGEKWAGNGSAFRSKSKIMKLESYCSPNQHHHMAIEPLDFSVKRPRMCSPTDPHAESSKSDSGDFNRQNCEYGADNYTNQVSISRMPACKYLPKNQLLSSFFE